MLLVTALKENTHVILLRIVFGVRNTMKDAWKDAGQVFISLTHVSDR